MKNNKIYRHTFVTLLTALFATLGSSSIAAESSPDYFKNYLLNLSTLTNKQTESQDVIIYFQNNVSLKSFKHRGRKTLNTKQSTNSAGSTIDQQAISRRNMLTALKSQSQESQNSVIRILSQRPAAKSVKQLWLINAIAASATPAEISALAKLPNVKKIAIDQKLKMSSVQKGLSAAPEWNLDIIKVPELWNLGFTGTGTVVANMDSGVDNLHNDLSGSWRGGENSWYDPRAEYAAPHDSEGHGTQTMSVIVGGNAGGTDIGVAPGAKWIAVKLFSDNGTASVSEIHQSFQWLLDPDSDPDTNDSPDVVNNSWGFSELVGQCYVEFETDISTLNTAGIAVVFSGGNQGAQGSISPADNPSSFAVGAVDASMNVTSTSSGGPSACDSSFYPEVVAPGEDIKVADKTFGGEFPNNYATLSGTSFAAPHVAGTIALLRQAFPTASVEEMEKAIKESAVDLGEVGPDNSSGFGMLDALAAYEKLKSIINEDNLAPSANSDVYTINEDSVLVTRAGDLDFPGVLDNDPGPGSLTAELVTVPANGELSPTLSEDGAFTYTPNEDFSGFDSFTYRANDGNLSSSIATVTITVNAQNDAPEAVDDAYEAAANGVLEIDSIRGLLANDTDLDGDDLTVNTTPLTAPVSGSLELNADGSFTYSAAGLAQEDSFVYEVCDTEQLCDSAMVNFTIVPNAAPRASKERAGVTRNSSDNFINLTANDHDSDGNLKDIDGNVINGDINSGEIILIRGNSTRRGGTISVDPTGNGVIYTPKPGFKGVDKFWYQVTDTHGAKSNVVRVKIYVSKSSMTIKPRYWGFIFWFFLWG